MIYERFLNYFMSKSFHSIVVDNVVINNMNVQIKDYLKNPPEHVYRKYYKCESL